MRRSPAFRRRATGCCMGRKDSLGIQWEAATSLRYQGSRRVAHAPQGFGYGGHGPRGMRSRLHRVRSCRKESGQ
jgi:hypothetical protein